MQILNGGSSSTNSINGNGGVNQLSGTNAIFGTTSLTKYTLEYTSPYTYTSPVAILPNALVFYNGMLQQQDSDYTVSGNLVIFIEGWIWTSNTVVVLAQ